MAVLDKFKLGRDVVGGSAVEYPLKTFANRARDLIVNELKKKLNITKISDDFVYGTVCKLIYVNHHSDAAFIALYAEDDPGSATYRAKVIRRFYRAVSNPIALEKVAFTGEIDYGPKVVQFEEYFTNLRNNNPYLGKTALIKDVSLGDLAAPIKLTLEKNTNTLFELKSNFLAPLTTKSDKPKPTPPKQPAAQGKAPPANTGKPTTPPVKGNQPAADKKKKKK